MINLKIGGMIVAAFIAGAFIASPELRAYAANTVYSTDIVDGEVKNPDIAAGAVTNSKIAGNSISNTKIQDNAVTLSKIAANSVDGSKILDNSITAADIGVDAVRASELAGVSKLIFAQCPNSTYSGEGGSPGSIIFAQCVVSGVDAGDAIVAMIDGADDSCYGIDHAYTYASGILVGLRNHCDVSASVNGKATISAIVFKQ